MPSEDLLVRPRAERDSFVGANHPTAVTCVAEDAATSSMIQPLGPSPSGPQIVAAKKSATGPFKLGGAGVKLKFKRTKTLPGKGIAGFIHESGTFTDEKGHKGTYSLPLLPVFSSIQPPQILDIAFKISGTFAGGSRRYTLSFTPSASASPAA